MYSSLNLLQRPRIIGRPPRSDFKPLPDDSPRLSGTASPNGLGSASTSSSKRQGYPTNPNLSQTNANPNALIQYTNANANSNPNHLLASQEQLAKSLNLDPALLQTTIGSLLQSPAAAEMFLDSLTHSVQGQALNQPSTLTQAAGSNSEQCDSAKQLLLDADAKLWKY